MLINADLFMGYFSRFRVAELAGGFGSGKTLSSFQLAHDLVMSGKFRYILSNLNSIWTDSPEDIVLREDQYVDAVVILDEGGLFLKHGNDADKFMAGLRKLNIAILIPSVMPPSTRIQFLSLHRTLNLQTMIGLPYWHYKLNLNVRSVKDEGWFGIYKPSQMYGVYDTNDYPVDDAYLSEWLTYWIETIQAKKPKWQTWGPPPEFKERKRGVRSRKADVKPFDEMESVGRIAEQVFEASEGITRALSSYDDPGRGKKGKR